MKVIAQPAKYQTIARTHQTATQANRQLLDISPIKERFHGGTPLEQLNTWDD